MHALKKILKKTFEKILNVKNV